MPHASDQASLPETQHLLDCIFGGWRTQAIHAAIQLGVVEELRERPSSTPELASILALNVDGLTRLLQALCALGVCKPLPQGNFRLTSTGALLTKAGLDGLSLRALSLWWGGPMWQLWPGLQYSVRSGRSYREKLTGLAQYGHLESSQEQAAVFHEAMRSLTALVAPSIASLPLWKLVNNFVDVGGGSGQLALSVLHGHAHLRATVFDLGHAELGATAQIASCGLAGRCQFKEGSFFEKLPEKADVYLMKSILHNWDDAHAGLILAACRAAAMPGARLVLVERIRPEVSGSQSADEAVARADLNMLAGLGGRERTLKEFRSLIESYGFQFQSMHSTDFEFSVMVATVGIASP